MDNANIDNANDGEVLGRRHGAERGVPRAKEAQQMEKSGDRQPQRLPIKLYRTDDLVTVAAPMPGLGPGDVAIVVSPERRLVIVGRLCADSDENCGTLKAPHKEVLLDEWQVGPYRREIELPTDVDGERATVTYGNGILVIALPVAATTRPARLTLDHVDTHVRGARVGDPNRRVGSAVSGDDRARTRSGAALVAGGAAALYLLRRGSVGRSLLALVTGSIAPAVWDRARRARQARSDAEERERNARKPVSPWSSDDPVDEASWESFPASDPPSFTGSRARAFD